MEYTDLIGHVAFGLIAFSFLVKDILWLRLVSILASAFGMAYNYFIPANPMWIAIGWNGVFIALNLYHIAVLIYEKRPIKMAPKDKELYETMFKGLSPVEYLKISKVAEWQTFDIGEKVTQQGTLVEDLVLIYNGTVEVEVGDKIVAELKDGPCVGEMSFLTEKPATATCRVTRKAECLVWKQPEFKDLLKRNPSLYYTIQSLLSNQLVSYSSK